MERSDALLIVDVQNDFCPGGMLPVPEGDHVVPVLNHWIEEAERKGIPVYFSRDWHPAAHISFKERGGPWPPHCIQGTQGAAFHSDLHVPVNAEIISKGFDSGRDSYSAFGGTDLAQRLRDARIRRLWIGGLAQDYCVRETVLDGIAEGFEVHVISSATRPVDVHTGDGDRALGDMRLAGAILEK